MPSLGYCPSCNSRFSFMSVLKRQRCDDCRSAYCGKCSSVQLDHHRCVSANGVQNVKCCMLCKLYRAGPQHSDREYLTSLTIRDLKEYLAFLEISTEHCISKTDLVDLITGAASANARRGCRPKPAMASSVPARPKPVSTAKTHGQPSSSSSSSAASAQATASGAAAGTRGSRASTGASASTRATRSTSNASTSNRASSRSESHTAASTPRQTPSSSASASTAHRHPPPEPNDGRGSDSAAGTGSSSSAETPHTTGAAPSTHVPTSGSSGSASSTAPNPSSEAASRRRGQRVDIYHIGAEDISTLSVMQLKETLAVNFIDFRGCVEKRELVELVMKLWMEKHPLPGEATTTSDGTEESTAISHGECRICMDEEIDCVLLECGHMCCCVKCGRKLAECPMCRRYVSRVVHVFKS